MSPRLRTFALTAHVVASVGWLGAVAAFLVLSIVGLASDHAQTVRSVYVAMNLVGALLIVPLSLAALLTGLVQALGTHWGLVKHYWVMTKFVLTIAATALLLLHQFTAVTYAARRVADGAAGTRPDLGGVGVQLTVDAAAAVVLLLVTTTLSVYKPWGKTSYGRRLDAQQSSALSSPVAAPPVPIGLRVFLAVIGVILGAILVVHLAGGGLRHH